MTVKVRHTLAMGWARVERQTYQFDGTPYEITPRERSAARTMFYAGAAWMCRMVNRCEDSDEFVRLMERVGEELNAFHDQNRKDAEPLLEEMERNGYGKINRRNRPEGRR